MRKFFALIHNEWIKLTHRKAPFICLGLTIAMVLGLGLMILLNPYSTYQYQPTDTKILQTRLNQAQKDLEDFEKRLSSTSNSDPTWRQVAENIARTKAEIDTAKFTIQMVDKKINEHGWIREAYQAHTKLRTSVHLNELYKKSNLPLPSTPESPTDATKIAALEQELTDIILATDFERFIAFRPKYLDATGAPALAKAAYAETDKLWLSADKSGGVSDMMLDGFIQKSLSHFRANNTTLATNVYNGVTISLARRQFIENENKIIKANFENKNFGPNQSSQQRHLSTALGITSAMLIILMSIFGGSMVSQEVQSGAIKILLIVPVKRFKIFWAKVVALFLVALVASLVAWLIVVATSYALVGGIPPYAIDSTLNGSIITIPSLLMIYLVLFFTSLTGLLFAIFAMTLSIAFKSSAAAISASVALATGGAIVTEILSSLFPGKNFLNFLPFNNLPDDWLSLILPKAGANLKGSDRLFNPMVSPSDLTFSIVYIAIFAFLLLFISREAFCKKDMLK